MTLLFVGDVMLGRLVNDALKRAPPEYPWGDTLRIFKQADVRICNLECVISDRGQPWSATEKVFHFRSDAKNIAVLKAAHINAVSLANNHALDFEYEAMFDCLKILDRAHIAHAGAGKTIEEASNPTIVEHKGIKIGLISFTDNEPAWEAAKTKPGIFYVPIDISDERAQQLFSVIRNTKFDLLIAAAHWGPNWGYQPPPEHPPFAHALIDAGADVIFGHSAHIVRGIEVYKGKPIFYSCGDFIDDYAVDEIERNDQSGIFMVEVSNKAISKIRFFPTVIRDFQARMARGSELEEIISTMSGLCAELNTKTQWRERDQSLEILLQPFLR